MTGLKRKVTNENNHSMEKGREFKNRKGNNSSSRTKGKEQNRPRRGPRLPNALRKELNLLNPAIERGFSDGDEDINFGDIVGNDVYKYEEGIPEEESKKNKRFDPVDNYEYELPKDFEPPPDRLCSPPPPASISKLNGLLCRAATDDERRCTGIVIRKCAL
ncbi:unnamed protein product [Fraxinus pennsylvanica]|uniref:Uncharacterized protein n=1 Tax=Fraxinus pennsylvanica TaxID=56036 RepID=A0AAD2E0T2_9LAMI|nr:unnamed protein product [Fraxinus pennsylvanica]